MTDAATYRENPKKHTIEYDDRIVRWFLWASVAFSVVGLLVGLTVAVQLAWWPANVEPYLTFGRLRPLHTNAVIFAFVGNMLFAGDLLFDTEAVQKHDSPVEHPVVKIHFWGWQLIIVVSRR